MMRSLLHNCRVTAVVKTVQTLSFIRNMLYVTYKSNRQAVLLLRVMYMFENCTQDSKCTLYSLSLHTVESLWNYRNVSYMSECGIRGCLDVRDCIRTVIIPIMPAVLLVFRHFISFPFCWCWFTRGSQRAPSKGGELRPWALRSVWSDICSSWGLEMIWNQAWLIQCCLGFTESVHKESGLCARVCDCVVSACLCISLLLSYSFTCVLDFFLSVWPLRLIPIALYLSYVLTPFIKESEVFPDSDPSVTCYNRNSSKYCTRWGRHLPDS